MSFDDMEDKDVDDGDTFGLSSGVGEMELAVDEAVDSVRLRFEAVAVAMSGGDSERLGMCMRTSQEGSASRLEMLAVKEEANASRFMTGALSERTILPHCHRPIQFRCSTREGRPCICGTPLFTYVPVA